MKSLLENEIIVYSLQIKSLLENEILTPTFNYNLQIKLQLTKGSFTPTAAVCGFRSGLRQRKDRNFSISAEQRNRLPQTHAENAVMWMSLKEITNFSLQIELQLKQLRPKDEFTTDSDCEVLLHLYKHHGPDFLTKVFVNGMYAFVLYDECEDVFVVARDPVGIIPLYIGYIYADLHSYAAFDFFL